MSRASCGIVGRKSRKAANAIDVLIAFCIVWVAAGLLLVALPNPPAPALDAPMTEKSDVRGR